MAQWRKVIVSGSDAELNTLDIGGGSGGSGTTLSTAGAITADAAVTAGTSFVIGGADIDETDLEKLDGIANGTAAANKAVVLDGSKNIATIGTVACGAITTSGALDANSTSNFQGLVTVQTGIVPDASDGAYLGTSSLEFSDLFLADAAVISLGDGGADVTLTHVADTGVLLNSDNKIQFGDSGTFIHQSSDGVLTITSDTTVDINGAVVFDGNVSGIGTLSSGAATVASLICTAAGTFGGGYGATGATISTAGVIQADGNIETAGSFVIGSADMDETDLEKLDGITNGAGAANKALVLDGSADIVSGINNLLVSRLEIDADTNYIDVDTDLKVIAAADIVLDPGGNNVLPGSDAADDLGASGTQWKDLYVHGIGYIDQLGTDADPVAIYVNSGELDGVTIGGESAAGATVTTLSATGDVDLGDATSDTITATGRFDSDIVPSSDSARDLGTSALQFAEAHIDAGYIDAVTVTGTSTLTTVDINGGAIDATAIGAATPAAGTFTSLAATGNAIITGDLTVNGTTTTLATTNLAVGDQFIFAATGSAETNVDAGIIVQSGSAIDSGSAIYHDINSQRWAVATGIGSIAQAVTPKQMVVTTTLSAATPGSGNGDYGVGEMWVETDTQDIWIRTA
jgi:hypothetical protein